ncbi:MAG TPA: hypothetical protein VKU00_00745 [Chthonomonadaceae bacterium]|nr:hypothetical protein [Chthonomonadaceae bacterium]
MPNETEIAAQTLKPTGETLLTPALGNVEENGYRVVLEGLFRFSHNDMAFDAVRKADASGNFTQAHDYLAWTPQTPPLEEYDPASHRAVFRIPAEWHMQTQSVGVRVNVDQFVNEFVITPGEVRAALSGEMQMRVLQVSLAPPSPWPAIVGTSIPAALLLGGVGWVVRRRMTLGGLAQDLQHTVGRIEQKFRAARAAVRPQDRRLVAVQERLNAVKAGALTLARQVQELRNAQNLLQRPQLEEEIKMLQRQLVTLPEGTAKQECEKTLVEKHKAQVLLEDMSRAEAGCAMRLAKVEAVLDTTCLTLRSVKVGATEVPAEDAICRALDAEVSAIHEAEKQIAACETLQMQVLGRR